MVVVALLGGWRLATAADLSLLAARPQSMGPEAGPGRLAPRGLCVPISRAIPASSRCLRHLAPDVGARRTGSTTGPPDTTSGGQSTGASAINKLNIRPARLNSVDKSAEMAAAKTDVEPAEADEELVYVRYETLGNRLTDLNTQPINERLLLRALGQLSLGPGDEATDDVGNDSRGRTGGRKSYNSPASPPTSAARDGDAAREAIGAAQLGGEASEKMAAKCRAAVERLLCRLVYPSCHFRRADLSALVRPPCREDCLLLRDVVCFNLNWAQFVRKLNAAFNATLRSEINQLDLAVGGGEPGAASALLAQHLATTSAAAGDSGEPAGDGPSTGDTTATAAAAAAATRPGPTASSLQPDDAAPHLNESTTTTASAQPPPPPPPPRRLPGLARGYDLNSSLHFYWPHERSIEECELLPPLRPLVSGARRRALLFQEDGPLRRQRLQRAPVGWPVEALPAPSSIRGGPGAQQRSRPKASWPICSNARLTETASEPPEADHLRRECMRSPDGADYLGNRNYTAVGLPCQHWSIQWPHRHKSSELLFDNMHRAHNYCRNPGGLELRPWCYTTDPRVKWQYCDIALC